MIGRFSASVVQPERSPVPFRLFAARRLSENSVGSEIEREFRRQVEEPGL